MAARQQERATSNTVRTHQRITARAVMTLLLRQFTSFMADYGVGFALLVSASGVLLSVLYTLPVPIPKTPLTTPLCLFSPPLWLRSTAGRSSGSSSQGR